LSVSTSRIITKFVCSKQSFLKSFSCPGILLKNDGIYIKPPAELADMIEDLMTELGC
jgi:hypothetical protein